MMPSLVPSGVAVAEVFGGEDDDSPIAPEEAAAIAGAVPSRRGEFAAGRACARRALAKLGWPALSIPADRDRVPIWPADLVGSITHCPGYRAAAVAPSTQLLGLGIDAEPHRPLPDAVVSAVLLPVERERIRSAPAGVCWDTVVFSTKESLFKAWFPCFRTWLEFADAEVYLDPASRRLRAVVRSGPTTFEGAFAVRGGRVYTAVHAAR